MRKIFQSAIAAILICGLSVLTACSNDDETIVVPPDQPYYLRHVVDDLLYGQHR